LQSPVSPVSPIQEAMIPPPNSSVLIGSTDPQWRVIDQTLLPSKTLEPTEILLARISQQHTNFLKQRQIQQSINSISSESITKRYFKEFYGDTGILRK
jgi:hypothetical protein